MRMKRNAAPWVLLVGVVIVLAACGQVDGGAAGGQPLTMDQLSGRTFVATAGTRGGEPFTVVKGSALTVSFADGQLSASAGCNSMGGPAQVVDGVLVIDGGLMQTEMACAQPLMEQEDWFATFLTAKPSVTLDGDLLTLVSGSDEVPFAEQVPVADQPLVGTTWMLTGIVSGTGSQAGVSTVPAGVDATVVFGESGRVTPDAGCNRISGKYTVDDGAITVTALASTRMACPGPEGEVEDTMLRVLNDGSVDYVIAGDTLTLTRGDAGLVFTSEVG